MSRSTRAVCSSGVPTGMSTTTWNSDLLSKGSIFITTSLNAASEIEPRIKATITIQSFMRLRAPRLPSRNGSRMRVNSACNFSPPAASADGGACLSRRAASHGVTMNAMASEISMPMLALIGIGLMYGPISPLTKAIGNSAAMTVSVARMVGPPTSSTAPGMISARVPESSWLRRWMFSTTTIASSTRMPIEKMSAKSDTRFRVKPHAHEAKSVAARVSITATPTIKASRRPRVSQTSATTERVAKMSFWMSFIALSFAVSP